MQLRHLLASMSSAVALSMGAQAHALPQIHLRHQGVRAPHPSYNEVYGRGNGPRYGQYGPPSYGARGWYGQRGDDRWRWYDGAHPGDSWVTFGGLAGPPYDRPSW